MIEYIYDAIRASSGEDIAITAFIDSADQPIKENCSLILSDDNKALITIKGEYLPDMEAWSFKIPGEATIGLEGRYWYQILSYDMSINFKKPIYLK